MRAAVVPTADATAVLRPLDTRRVTIRHGFWGDRLAQNRQRALPHGAAQLEQAGNLDNFRAAAAGHGRYRGGSDDAGATFPFLDSDVYKWLEAAGWELGRAQDATLERTADTMIELVRAAQRPDGYVNTYVQLTSPRGAFADLQWGHELYCIGHLVQAAIAWQRSLGDNRLLSVAERAVDRVAAELGMGGRKGVDGHPEIEMALVELYRLTGDSRRLDLARRFLDERGHGLLGPGRYGPRYWQDHEPVRAAPTVAGHAVRQLYLDCGAVDLAVETGDEELLAAVVQRWDDMVATRMYVTGALGSRHRDESFGDPYELPPDRAYAETCAAIGSLMLAWRLLLATGESKYADVAERTLFNAVLPALSHDATHFFYVNPLQRRGDGDALTQGAASYERRPWFACACCPPNVMRVLSSLEQQLATVDGDGVQIHQYADASISFDGRGGEVVLSLSTEYPWEGAIEIRVAESPSAPWRLALRIPTWCRTATVSVDAVEHPVSGGTRFELERSWAPGEVVRLRLEMPVRITRPHPRIDAVRGCVCLERGPLVHCLEQADLPERLRLEDVAIECSASARPVPADDLPGAAVALELAVTHRPQPPQAWPYEAGEGASATRERVTTRAIPYFSWGNRAAGGMRVWVPLEHEEQRCASA